MSEDPLYRRALLRLAADATGAGHLSSPDAQATRHNPVCGDSVTVELSLDDGRVAAIAHMTHACVLTQAAAALLARQAIGLDVSELDRLAAGLRSMLAGATPPDAAYAVFDGVADHPGRHVCVLLPVEAALEALQQNQDSGR